MSLRIAVAIATHNRRGELARTLDHVARLDPPPDEILVCADGCTDDTAALVREKHPSARLLVHETARGSIPSRNKLAQACGCDVFVSLDDDSYPLDPNFIARVHEHFAAAPRLAVLAFAQRSDEFPDSLTATNFGGRAFVGSYANSGAAIRRETFVALGGYPDFFFHAYEEPDFALRCVCAGWQVRYEPALLVRHHFTAVQRNEIRTHHRHARNEAWSALMRCPAPQLFGVLLFRAVRQFAYACQRGPAWIVREPAWWCAALGGIARCLRKRNPLPWGRYLAWMRLAREPIVAEQEWNALFGERTT
ncbi:MAG: glycosyltransferase family A protein [Chthoniobacteraceae bacterium]